MAGAGWAPTGGGPLFSLEKTVSGLLTAVRLNSIRSKVIAFALLSTLLPSISMGWLSYRNNLKVLQDKIGTELTSLTSQTSRELELWLKERRYDVKVFANSYEVSENLERIAAPGRTPAERKLALGRLSGYLRAVKQRFADYQELAVLDLSGTVVATSAPSVAGLRLPAGWLEAARSQALIAGEPYRDPATGKTAMILAEAVSGSDVLLGLLAVRLDFEGLGAVLEGRAQGGPNQIHVVTRSGLIVASYPHLEARTQARLPADVTRDLFAGEGRPVEFVDARDQKVVGALRGMHGLDWGVVAVKDKATEYAEVTRVRNITLVLAASLLAGVGVAAYLLGLTLVRPLDRLIRGAGRVTAGDLEVDLPVIGAGEVGYLTLAFNRMVARIRSAREEIEATQKALIEKNQELREISITDDLTGLRNRKHMNETVVSELKRAERHEQPLSILMMDIDLFKTFNDARGHQAGDEVLRGVAHVLRETLRSTDYAARYGGEEFLILLPQTSAEQAMETAERIRGRIVKARLGMNANRKVISVSLGVAAYPECGRDAETVIREADFALYQAKRSGRNRVVGARALMAKAG